MTTYSMQIKGGGERRVTVPTGWKVTFGPTTPYDKKIGHGGDGSWAVRLYEGDKLRGIFTDVRNFQDMSIQIQEKRIRSKRQVVQRGTKHGLRDTIVEAKMETWVNPYEPDEANSEDEQFLLEGPQDWGDD